MQVIMLAFFILLMIHVLRAEAITGYINSDANIGTKVRSLPPRNASVMQMTVNNRVIPGIYYRIRELNSTHSAYSNKVHR